MAWRTNLDSIVHKNFVPILFCLFPVDVSNPSVVMKLLSSIVVLSFAYIQGAVAITTSPSNANNSTDSDVRDLRDRIIRQFTKLLSGKEQEFALPQATMAAVLDEIKVQFGVEGRKEAKGREEP